eukprot:TRINITY_DN4394_c0_g1_i1.p1 TRINITY_DN4394_c0_g1~~TRINITY_DN4394_c0_g1_i1.p1  ORF type:complete len:438 (-),score=84.75 TRINITY_DN4394_c0_g1_i1:112-1425(-)
MLAKGEAPPLPYGSLQQGDVPTKMTKWQRFLMACGPGLVVMLADTDAGCIVTAAQTGATWGYSQIWLQLLLIPVVFMAQELTVRLGVYTMKGHGELIQEHFGTGWAWVSVVTLVVACAGALVSEFSGVVGVGKLAGIPPAASAAVAAVILTLIVISGKYRQVEKVAIVLGLFELVYLVTMVMAFRWDDFASSFFHIDISNPDYNMLMAANIGAVVMPWMIFYQQSAVVDKGLTVADLHYARQDTLIGAFLTQLIMSAVIITSAGTIWVKAGSPYPNENAPTEIGAFAAGISDKLGDVAGKVLFSIGMIGGALIGGIVVALTAAWGLGEVAGYKRSLEDNPRDAPWFYLVFFGCVVVGMVVTLTVKNLVYLNVAIQVMNALLLPIVLGFLWVLSVKALPEEFALKGWYKWFSAFVFVVCCGFAVFGGIIGIIDPSTVG